MPKQDSGRWKDLDAQLKANSVKSWVIKLLASINFSGPSAYTDLQKPQLQVCIQSHYKCCKLMLTELMIMLRTLEEHQGYFFLPSSYY